MGLQSSDLILVERSNTLYKETYGNRANIDSSDLIVVERTDGNTGIGTKYKCTYSNFSSANSTDLILVERTDGNTGIGTLYKETKSNWDFSAYADIHSANYMVTLGTLLYDQGEDSSNPYSVVEVQAEFSSSATVGDGTLYIGFRNSAGEGGTSGYPYYGDLPIAGIQILRANGTTIVNPQPGVESGYCWNFANSGDRSEWWTTRATITSKTASPEQGGGANPNPVYYTVGTSPTARRFSYTTSGTGSQEVGAARGISSSTYTGDDDTTTILAVGTANISQSGSSSDGYFFTECSGMSTGNLTWLSTGFTVSDLQNGDRIRICYFGGGNGPDAAKGLQTTDSLYVRYIED
jgi:hypothetical protein